MGSSVNKSLSSGVPSGNSSKKSKYVSRGEGKMIKSFNQEEKKQIIK